MNKRLLLVFIFVSLSSSLNSATYFVSTTGLDTNTGTQSSPWKTIQYAADNVSPGDTVLVNTGTYSETVTIEVVATAVSSITFRANGTNVIISHSSSWNGGVIFIGPDAEYIVIDGFTITGGGNANGIRVDVSDHITIKNCKCYQNYRGIFTDFSNYLLLENNVCHDNPGEHGIYVSNSCTYPTVRGNVLYGNEGAGLHMNGDQEIALPAGYTLPLGIISHALVENNIIYENGSGAALSMDGVQDSIVRNNLIYDNYSQGLTFFQIDGSDGSKRNKILNNTIYNTAGTGSRAMGIEDNSSDCTVMNNIIIGGSNGTSAVEVYNSSLVGLTMNNNIIYNNGSAGLVTNNNGSTYTTLSAWQSASGKDANSKSVIPTSVFLNIGTGTFRLSGNSQAKDAGATLSDVPADIDGKTSPIGSAYDIGCYEFGAPVEYFAISGYALDGSGAGISVVIVTLSGSTNTTTITSGTGYYEFSNISSGTFTITANKQDWVFSSPIVLTNISTNQNAQNFTGTYSGTSVLCSISGYIKETTNSPISGVTVSLSGPENTTALTDSTGFYQFMNLSTGTYVVTPGLTNWVFDPLSYSYSPLSSDQNNQNFTATYTGTTYKISGSIKDASGIVVHATIALTGTLTRSASTNVAGYYEFTGLPPGSYTVEPQEEHWVFDPANTTIQITNADITTQNFTGTYNGSVELVARNNLINPLKGDKVILTYNIHSAGNVSMEIYNLQGKLIKTVIDNANLGIGSHSVEWNGKDNGETVVPTGIYIVSLKQNGSVIKKKICVMK